MKYATKASRIRNKPKINQDEQVLLLKDLKERIKQLESDLKNANDHIHSLSNLRATPEGIYPQDGECSSRSLFSKQVYTALNISIAEESRPYQSNSKKQM